MALASATALSWRPLPPRPPSSSASSAHAAEVNSPRNSAISTSVRRVPGPPFSSALSAHAAAVKSPPNSAIFTSVRRVSPESYWIHSNCFCGNSLSNSVLWKFSSSPFLHNRLGFCILNLDRRSRRSGNGGVVTTRAGIRLDPGGGNDNEGGIVRGIVNLALAGGFTYLAVTGKLGWVFDTLVSLWLLAVLVPIISFVAFLWFAEREIVKVS